MIVRSGTHTTTRGIVGNALEVSKRKNLTVLELKVLTDVVHYEVNKNSLLRGSGQAANSRASNKKDVRIINFISK